MVGCMIICIGLELLKDLKYIRGKFPSDILNQH